MSSRNVDKGREAENAAAAVFAANGMPHAERRSKRGGYMDLEDGRRIHRDAGDLTGIPGVVVQVKWSGYAPLAKDMEATETQRQAAGADVGLLVRKRKGVGCGRAGEWDAYLPLWQLSNLLDGAREVWGGMAAMYLPDAHATVHMDLLTAVRLLAAAGYGHPVEVTR